MAAGVLAVLTTPLQSQQESKTIRPIGGLTFVDELELTVVNVVVNVTDASGNVVTDLTEQDFRVFQDGEEKQITNFALYTDQTYRQYRPPEELPLPGVERAEAVSDEVDESEQPDLRPIYIVLYIDNANIHPMQRNRVLGDVRNFVRSTLKPPVQMMVVSYQRAFQVLQPFTSDPQLVMDALREVRSYTGGRTERDAARGQVLELMNRMVEEERLHVGAQARNTYEYSQIYNQVLSFAQQERHDLFFTMDALRSVIISMSGLQGKKAIVYVSNGLPMVAGLELITAFSNTFQDYGVLAQLTALDRTAAYESLASVANANDVSLYTIDVGGLRPDDSAFSAEYKSSGDTRAAALGSSNYIDSLRYMADSTGGLAIVKTNDFEGGLGKIETDVFTYYSIGYTLHASGADKVHNIKVELRDHPEFDVRYRRRFVEKSLDTRVQDKVISALVFDVEDNPIGVEVEVGSPAPAAQNRWTVPIRVLFPLEHVALLPEGDDYLGRAVVYLAARDTEGKQSDLVRQEHDVRVPAADYDTARTKRYAIDASLLMEPGSYRLVVGLMDQVTRQASYVTTRAVVRD